MTRQARRRRGRLVAAGVAAWALVVALVVALSVAGGVKEAGANPVGQSPEVYIGGDGGVADAFTLGALGGGGASGTPVAKSPGSFNSITAIAVNSTATEALMGIAIDPPLVELDLVSVASNAIVFADETDLRDRIMGIAMDPTHANVAYVVTSDQSTNGVLYKVTISGATFSVADLTPSGLGIAPTSVAIAPNGGSLFIGFTNPGASPPVCGIDALPVDDPTKSVLWEQCGSNQINDVAVSPDGSHVYAAAGVGRTGELIDLATPISATESEPPNWPKSSFPFVYKAVTVSPDSSTVYAGESSGATNRDARVEVIAASGTVTGHADIPLQVNPSEQGGISGIALSPDNRSLIAVGWHGATNATSAYVVNLTTLVTGPDNPFPASFGTTTGPQDVAITPDQAPVAAVSSAGAVQVGHAITLNATPSSVRYGSITNFAWTFDDGGTASGETVTHVFNTVGAHTATVLETDEAGTTVPETVSGFPIDTAGQTPYARSDPSAQTTVGVDVTAGPPPSTIPTTTLPHHGTTTLPHHAPGAPTLTLKPADGPPGTIVTVTGSGFAHNTPITVSWSVSTGSVVIMSDSHGNLPPTPLYILTPDVLGPRFAQASSTPQATAQFLVVPSDSEPGGDNASLLYRSEGP